MDTTAQQATTSSSCHRENADSEGARRSFRPGHRMTLQNYVAISDRCDRTEGEKSELENTVGLVNGRMSAAATAARHNQGGHVAKVECVVQICRPTWPIVPKSLICRCLNRVYRRPTSNETDLPTTRAATCRSPARQDLSSPPRLC